MAISAATLGKDRVLRGPIKTAIQSLKPFLASQSFKQGDLLCLDTSAHTVRVVAATGDAATLLGVAQNSVTSGKLVGPYDGLTVVDAAQAVSDAVGPAYGAVMKMKLKASDAFNPGDKVYLVNGGDSQTVSVTDPGDGLHVGIFTDTAVSSAASGQEAGVLIGLRALLGGGIQF